MYSFISLVIIDKRQRSEDSHSGPQLTAIPICYESNQSHDMLNAEEAVWVEGKIIQEQVLLYLLFVMLYRLSKANNPVLSSCTTEQATTQLRGKTYCSINCSCIDLPNLVYNDIVTP